MTHVSGEKVLPGSRERVWALLTDPVELGRALPGSGEVSPELEGDGYRTTIALAVGPVKDVYEGTLRYEHAEPPSSCTIVVETAGRAGRLSGEGAMRLEPANGDGTLVRYEGEFKVTGRVASVGQRLLAGVARKTIEKTLDELGKRLHDHPAEAAAAVEAPTRQSAFWHPFANMAAVGGQEVTIERAHGSEVFDTNGRRYLDATASLWYCNVGYGRGEIAAAAERQLRELPAYSTFGVYTNRPAEAVSDRIAALAPLDDAKVFLTSGGSDAVDTAAKLARRYWHAVGRPGKQLVIGRQHAYHGMHAFGTSLAGIPANVEGLGELVADVVHVDPLDPEAFAAEIARSGADRIAAFIGEPVIGAGGVIPPPEGYWQRIAEICAENDVLLVADEVITGFGRLGRWFGSARFDIVPDMLVFAKGVTSGYLPLGGVVVGPRVAEPFWQGDGIFLRHGYTYSGHAAVCAAALANLDLIEREGLVERVAAFEPEWTQKISALAAHPLVAEVRAIGLLGAVELQADVISAEPGIVERAVDRARAHGVLTRSLRGCALHLSPAFTISAAEVDEIVAGLRAALDDLG